MGANIMFDGITNTENFYFMSIMFVQDDVCLRIRSISYCSSEYIFVKKSSCFDSEGREICIIILMHNNNNVLLKH